MTDLVRLFPSESEKTLLSQQRVLSYKSRMFKTLCFLTLLASGAAHSAESASLTSDIRDASLPEVGKQATYMTFGYKNYKSAREHKETSSGVGYYSLNEKTFITENSLELGLAHEFFNQSRFSITPFVKASMMKGSDSGEKGKAIVVSYKDKASGFGYTAGMSLNANFSIYKIRMQPFIAGAYVGSESTYKLSYERRTASMTTPVKDSQVEIEYENSAAFLQGSLGVRFFDFKESLMSYIAFDMLSNTKNTETVQGNRGKNIKLSKFSEAEFNNYAMTVGFGYIF
jgi:hypothetical protein